MSWHQLGTCAYEVTAIVIEYRRPLHIQFTQNSSLEGEVDKKTHHYLRSCCHLMLLGKGMLVFFNAEASGLVNHRPGQTWLFGHKLDFTGVEGNLKIGSKIERVVMGGVRRRKVNKNQTTLYELLRKWKHCFKKRKKKKKTQVLAWARSRPVKRGSLDSVLNFCGVTSPCFSISWLNHIMAERSVGITGLKHTRTRLKALHTLLNRSPCSSEAVLSIWLMAFDRSDIFARDLNERWSSSTEGI